MNNPDTTLNQLPYRGHSIQLDPRKAVRCWDANSDLPYRFTVETTASCRLQVIPEELGMLIGLNKTAMMSH